MENANRESVRAAERFARLFFQAAQVRLGTLMTLMAEIDKSVGEGELTMREASLLADASRSAGEVAENLKWAHRQLAEGGAGGSEKADGGGGER